MQAKGTLAETSLRSLIETAQTERATGTLSVADGGRACTLYFLFGHLFHADDGTASGDQAVVDALGWNEGEFSFDAKAKLPADETVKSSIPDLIQMAESPPPAPEWTAPTEPGRPDADSGAVPAEAGGKPLELESASAPEEPVDAAAPPREPAPEPAVEPLPAEAPLPRRGVKHRPQPQNREPVPVPAGQTIYDSLKTSFVDFPRLVSTLEKEGYTGYVRLLTDEASGLIFFREGQALECVYDDGQVSLGRSALAAFNDQVARGQGVLDVVALSPEVVDGLYQLTAAKPVYTELYASWVDMKALLNFLKDRGLTGSVMVRAAAGTGVIILTDGEVTGSYTSESREIASEVGGVLDLCQDSNAMIEVKAAGTEAPDLEADEALRGRPAPPPVPEPHLVERPAPEAAPIPPPPIPEPLAETPVMATSAPLAGPAERRLDPAITQTLPLVHATQVGVDWEQVITELQLMAEEALGNRARKVKEILAGAERSRQGVEEAIAQVPSISLLFVDSSRLEGLAEDMRVKLDSLTA